MKRTMPHVLAIAGATLILAGCGGDVTKQLTSNPAFQAQVMGAIAENAPLAKAMVGKLLGADSTRTLVLSKIMEDKPTMEVLLADIAHNEGALDGVLNVAAKDSVMRSHVVGVLQGIKMATR